MEKEKIILAIVGSRRWCDYPEFTNILEDWIKEHDVPTSIVSGGASGVDSMTRKWAIDQKIPLVEHLIDKKKYRLRASHVHHKEIVQACTHLLALPGLRSVGTFDSIKKARKAKKHITIRSVPN